MIQEPNAGRARPFAPAVALVLLVLLVIACRRPVKSLVMYIDPEPEVTFGLMYYYQREARVKVTQYHNHDYSGAAATALLTRERDHPKADVYWGGDPIYCEILRQRGLAIPFTTDSEIPQQYRDPHQTWIGFAARARVLLVREALNDKPQSIRAYTDPKFRGRGALANPLSGTTRSHFAALATVWGDQKLVEFYQALLHNGTHITKDTEESADLVVKGEADFALVDTDVAVARIQKLLPLAIIYPDSAKDQLGTMIIPNALMIVKGCKDFDAARDLVSYLTSLDGETRVVTLGPSHIPLNPGVAIRTRYTRRTESLEVMRFDYTAAAQKLLDMEKILNARN